MQETAREHWRNLFRKDVDEPPDMENEDFGFWLGDWQRALEMGMAFDQYRILPRAGGFLDQDILDWSDIMMYQRGKLWAYLESQGEGGAVPRPPTPGKHPGFGTLTFP